MVIIDTYQKNIPVDPESKEPIENFTKYYLTQLKFKADEPTESYLFDYDTQEEAFFAYHNNLSTDMENNNYIALMSRLEDKYGNEIKKRYWERGN